MPGERENEQRQGRAMAGRGAPERGERAATPLTVLPVVGGAGATRHCWEIVQAPDNTLAGTCEECYAYFIGRDCWTLWALREAGHKPCCQKQADCATCPVLLHQIAPRVDETVQIRARTPLRPPPPRAAGSKQVCRYLDPVDVTVSPESDQYLSAVSRAIQARNSTFRCRLRGVHVDVTYVADVCVSRHVEDCVFLEEAQPEAHVQGPGHTHGAGPGYAQGRGPGHVQAAYAEMATRKLPHDEDEAGAHAQSWRRDRT